MIDAVKLGRLLAEEAVKEPGPCFYPARFKPPHKGHYEVAMDLAAANYITELHIVISKTTTDGITPEDALEIWRLYLGNNPKIILQIADPIPSIMEYAYKHPKVHPIYVAASDDETDDQQYIESLQETFPDRIIKIPIHDKDENNLISAEHVRGLLRLGDYESFAKTIPEQAYNKGYAKQIFTLLAPKITSSDKE